MLGQNRDGKKVWHPGRKLRASLPCAVYGWSVLIRQLPIKGADFVVGKEVVKQEVVMNEKLKSEMISRRGAFMLLGTAAAFSVAVPVTIMTATDAEARIGNPGSAVSVAGANRRDRRQDRRYKNTKSPTTTTPTTSGQGEKK